MLDKLEFILNRIRERLWVKPLIVCLLSIAAALASRAADSFGAEMGLEQWTPEVSKESLVELLKICAASMLVIATLAVASMVSAYASAASTATPRTFALVIADDVSQNALSTFIGAFIFSIVALVALMNGYYGNSGRFVLCAITLAILALVIVTFVRWVDRIARLGRLGAVIEKVETATAHSLKRRRSQPTMRCAAISGSSDDGQPVFTQQVGYVQHIEYDKLQARAKKHDIHIRVAALPGAFVCPGAPIAFILGGDNDNPDNKDQGDGGDTKLNAKTVEEAFVIGRNRLFDEDPCFGFTVLSEIAIRGLSPAVNDPGTARDIVGAMGRLFVLWMEPDAKKTVEDSCEFDRVQVPELSLWDMFDDAFTAIAREGADAPMVHLRLQETLYALAHFADGAMRDMAVKHSRLALARVEQRLTLEDDLEVIRKTGLCGELSSEGDDRRP
ncbi:predicted membrane protein [Hahella chejuensis KCTC 2396]|uniref:Predicted membrane protein n=1 Tax=Hahella chejuensis (strain KCTC 2396) TaxID=349521 RepID=Q2SG21_HAHCH|nr:DUF2254 domain-containing protein [Hahella chejuensis]ABC30403.1 predicted membrane protein [Hahella chejuensis KCTC 2396]